MTQDTKTIPCPYCGTKDQFSEKDFDSHCTDYCEFLNKARVEKEIAQRDLLALERWLDDPVTYKAIIDTARMARERDTILTNKFITQVKADWEEREK